MEQAIGDVLIDGEAHAPQDAAISVFDIGFQRGYGVFEAMRSYAGRIFRLGPHLDRLAASANKLDLPLPSRDDLEAWARRVARGGDGVVRILVSGGLSPVRPGTGHRVVTYLEPMPEVAETLTVQPRVAPWHPAGRGGEIAGAKSLSYGPNLAASLAARRSGFDDALLHTVEGIVLEGPTYAVGWVANGIVETPSLEVGILASITRAAVLVAAAEAGIEVLEGVFSLDRLAAADEVFLMSTVKEVRPVVQVGGNRFTPGPVTARLAQGFRSLVERELRVDVEALPER